MVFDPPYTTVKWRSLIQLSLKWRSLTQRTQLWSDTTLKWRSLTQRTQLWSDGLWPNVHNCEVTAFDPTVKCTCYLRADALLSAETKRWLIRAFGKWLTFDQTCHLTIAHLCTLPVDSSRYGPTANWMPKSSLSSTIVGWDWTCDRASHSSQMFVCVCMCARVCVRARACGDCVQCMYVCKHMRVRVYVRDRP